MSTSSTKEVWPSCGCCILINSWSIKEQQTNMATSSRDNGHEQQGPPKKRPKLMSSKTMEAELTSQQRVFWNDDLVRYVARYVVNEYALVFILTCRGFRRAHASLRLGPILSKVRFHCGSAALVKWAISMGCPTAHAHACQIPARSCSFALL